MVRWFVAFLMLWAASVAVKAQTTAISTIVCAPIQGFAQMNRTITSPVTGNSYQLDGRGCANVPFATDRDYFATQGIGPELLSGVVSSISSTVISSGWSKQIDFEKAFGGVCDAVRGTGGGTSVGSTTFSGAVAFNANDIGKAIQINGAGAGGAPMSTTIRSTNGVAAILQDAPLNNSGSGFQNAFYAQPRVDGNGLTSYKGGDTVTVGGGTPLVSAVVTIDTTRIASATVGGAMANYHTGDKLYLLASDGTQLGKAIVMVTETVAGVITNFQISQGGRFSVNPTGLTPIASGTTGSGAVFTPVAYGAAETRVTTPGVYSTAPTMPASTQALVSTGVGLTLDLAFNTGGDYAYGTDNSTQFAAAIAAAHANNGALITMPPKSCGTTSTITVNNNHIGFIGGTAGTETKGRAGELDAAGKQTLIAGSSSVMWLGAPGGTIMSISPVLNNTQTSLVGNLVQGLTFWGNTVAARGLSFTSVTNFRAEDLAFQDFSEAGLFIGVGPPGTVIASADSQHFFVRNITGSIIYTAGDLIVLDGSAVSDASAGIIENVYATHTNGRVLLFNNSDNISLRNVHVLRKQPAFAPAIEFSCNSARPLFMGRELYGDSIFTSTGGLLMRGIEWCGGTSLNLSGGSSLNSIMNYDLANAEPVPIIGEGSQLAYRDNEGGPHGQVAHGQVYFDTVGVVSQTTIKIFNNIAAGDMTFTGYRIDRLVTELEANRNTTTAITSGAAILALNFATSSVTLNLPFTGAITSGANLNFVTGVKVCPENGNGLIVGTNLYSIPGTCIYKHMTSPANRPLVNGSWEMYVGTNHARVIDVASNGLVGGFSTGNVRLTLDNTVGLETGNIIKCSLIAGTSEAVAVGTGGFTASVVDKTHVDLINIPFVHTYLGGGRCWWFSLNPSYLKGFPGFWDVYTQQDNQSWTDVGFISTSTDANSNAYINPNAEDETNATGNETTDSSGTLGHETTGIISRFNRKPKRCINNVMPTPLVSLTPSSAVFEPMLNTKSCWFAIMKDYFNPGGQTIQSGVIHYSVNGEFANTSISNGCVITVEVDQQTSPTAIKLAKEQVVAMNPTGQVIHFPLSLHGSIGGLEEGIHNLTIWAKTINGGSGGGGGGSCRIDNSTLSLQVWGLF